MHRVECSGQDIGKADEGISWRYATEAQLRETNSPRILHLATHGFSCLRAQMSIQVTNRNFRKVEDL